MNMDHFSSNDALSWKKLSTMLEGQFKPKKTGASSKGAAAEDDS
jgi:hypothetical protein